MPGPARVCAALATLAAVLLTGCGAGADDHPAAKPTRKASTSAATAPTATAPTAAPPVFVPARVGQCWNATFAQAAAPSWEGAGAVACTEKHNAVTYAVATLPDDLSFGTAGTPTLAPAVARNECSYLRAQKSVGHSFDNPVRVTPLWYYPTPAQYSAGARQLRCDLAVRQDTAFRALPSRLSAAAFAGHAYQICAMGAHAAGPKKEGKASYAPCTRSSTFHLVKYVELKTKPNQRFPGRKAVIARTQQACPMLRNLDWVVYPTNAKAWAGGHTMGGCWLWVG